MMIGWQNSCDRDGGQSRRTIDPMKEILVTKGTMVSLANMYKTVNIILTWDFPCLVPGTFDC